MTSIIYMLTYVQKLQEFLKVDRLESYVKRVDDSIIVSSRDRCSRCAEIVAFSIE